MTTLEAIQLEHYIVAVRDVMFRDGRQRINANGFLKPYDFFSWKKNNNQNKKLNDHVYKI